MDGELTIPVDQSTPQPACDHGAGGWGRLHVRWLIVILLIASVLEAAVWMYFAPNRTYQVFWSMPVVSATLLAIVLWWLLGGGFRRPVLIRRAAVLAAVAAAFFGSLRFEGFEGDMIPRYRLRWHPSAQERLAAYLSTATQPRADASSATNRQNPEQIADSTADTATVSAKPLIVSEEDWPEYRGPNRDGVTRHQSGEFDWTTEPVELWRHPVGAGWSSFAVVQGLAFTQEQREEHECVVCYDMTTSEQVWVHDDAVRFDEAMGGPGPRATPTVRDSKVYALGATGILNCLDAVTGKLIWRRDILKDAKATNIHWAMSGSPLLVDRLVIVNSGGPDGHGVTAYDQISGEPVWSGGSDPASYAAPKLATLLGVRQVLIFDAVGLAGHAFDTGNQLWKLKWSNGPQVNAADPIVIDDHSLLIGSGYDRGSALVAVKRDGDRWLADTVWTSRRLHLKFNAAVERAGFVYGLDEGILECLQVSDGQMKWKKGRYGYGQLLLAGDVLVVLTEQGEVAFVKASPERHEELGKYTLLTGKTWNHPVLWRDRLLVRNGEEAACFQLTRQDDSSVP